MRNQRADEDLLWKALVHSSPDGILAFDREFRYTVWNGAMERIAGVPAARVLGRVAWEVFPFLKEQGEDAYLEAALAGEVAETADRPFRVPESGREGYFRAEYAPLRNREDEIIGGMAVVRESTASWHARAEHARLMERVEFLADASAVLAQSLDVEETLRQLTRMVVARLADACAIDLASGEGTLQRVSVLSRDPQKVQIVQELEQRYPTPLDSPAGHTTAFRTGEPQLYTAFPDELLRSASRDEEHFKLWKALEMQAVINAPLIARGRTLGVITLVSNTPGRIFDQADVNLLLDLASRAAQAIDNARLYTESQEANRAKADFLAAMSHELRTPLNAIAGYIDLIDLGIHGPVNEAQRHALERVKRNQEDLLRLINDVLYFAKLEAGRLEFAITDLPLPEILEATTSAMEPQAQARGIAVAVHPYNRSASARADADRVRQILQNLVGNSLKFTAPGGWVLLRCDTDTERVYVQVQDNGRGIPGDRLAAVFDPFVQHDRHRHETSQQGVGLGLAISRDLARGMGGDLVAESEEGVGSTFTLVLPRGRTSVKG